MSQIQIQKVKSSLQRIVEILRTTDPTKQIIGNYFDGKGGMCAMGAIKFGFGINNEKGEFLIKGADLKYEKYCQAMGELSRKGMNDIVIMNDEKGMTFSEIADYLEQNDIFL